MHSDSDAQKIIHNRIIDSAISSGFTVDNIIDDDTGLELNLDFLDGIDTSESSANSSKKKEANKQTDNGIFEGSENFFMD